jgi:hypothetical protein
MPDLVSCGSESAGRAVKDVDGARVTIVDPFMRHPDGQIVEPVPIQIARGKRPAKLVTILRDALNARRSLSPYLISRG